MVHKNVELEVAKCFESPTNPRGVVFEKAAQTELAASIKQKGVLMPVLARQSKDGKYEIIAGNRRLRAVKEIGLAWIPARVVEMTDEEVREAQIVENLQRADIHPIDEALAYQALISSAKPPLDAEGIAAKVGKSQSYIRMRLGLLNLEKQFVQKVREDVLPIAHAQLIARLPKEAQQAAYSVAVSWNGSVCPLATLRSHVTNAIFAQTMKSPPWANDEAAQAEIARVTGIKGGGATLFGEKAATSFDDPAEFARALAAYIKIVQDKYKADGKKLALISGDYGKSGKGAKVLSKQRYNLVSEVKGCKSGQDALIVEGHNAGKIVRVCTDRTCEAHHPHLKARNREPAEETAAQKKKREAAEKREAAKRAREHKAFRHAIDNVGGALTEMQIDVLFENALESFSGHVDDIGEIYGLEPQTSVISPTYTSVDYAQAVIEYFGKSKTLKLQLVVALHIRGIWNPAKRAKALKRL